MSDPGLLADTLSDTKLGGGGGGGALQESKAANIQPLSTSTTGATSTGPTPTPCTTAGAVDPVAKLVKDLHADFTRQLADLRAEFAAALAQREEEHQRDLVKLRVIMMRSFQLPDEFVAEGLQGVSEFDEQSILF